MCVPGHPDDFTHPSAVVLQEQYIAFEQDGEKRKKKGKAKNNRKFPCEREQNTAGIIPFPIPTTKTSKRDVQSREVQWLPVSPPSAAFSFPSPFLSILLTSRLHDVTLVEFFGPSNILVIANTFPESLQSRPL